MHTSVITDHDSYLVIELADAPTQNILGQLPAVCAFISEGLASGGAVLIHGLNGISRRFEDGA